LEVTKIYPEYYRAILTQSDKRTVYNGVSTDNSALKPTNRWINEKIQSDYFQARSAAEKVQKLDEKVQTNPYNNNPLVTNSKTFPTTEKQKNTPPILNYILHNPVGKTAWASLGVIPQVRRVAYVPTRLENDDIGGAVLQGALMAYNFPADLTMLAKAGENLQEIATNGFKNTPRNAFQREFPLLRGSILDGKLPWLEKFDKTLFHTKFGDKVLNFFKISVNPEEDFIRVKGFNTNAKQLLGVKCAGGVVQNVAQRTLLRISTLGLAASAVMELPSLVKSVTKTEGSFWDKSKALGKQLLKSAGQVGLVTLGIGVAGAIAFPLGAVAELIAMCVGSAVSLAVLNSLNKKIDNVIQT
jgi:hypothetical protein